MQPRPGAQGRGQRRPTGRENTWLHHQGGPQDGLAQGAGLLQGGADHCHS